MSEANANDQATDASELTRDVNKLPDLTQANKVSDDLGETLVSAPAMELAHHSMASASTTKANEHDKFQSKTKLPCHFMKIPPEIRLEIYKNVFSEVLEKKDESKGKNCPYWKSHMEQRVGIMCDHIKTALAMFHTSHKMRIEALPICQQLTDAVLTSVVSELDLLKPDWRTWSIYGVLAFLKRAQEKEPSDDVWERCRELKGQHDGVSKIGRALQLVEGSL